MILLPRLRSEQDGFTLTELLAAMVIGSIVLTALMKVFISGVESTYKVTDRVEASQRARLTMDRVVTLLNSQTCLYASNGTSNPPISDGQAQQVTFYANLGDVSADPMRYRLRYDAPTKTVWEDRFVGTRDATGNLNFPAGPSLSRAIGTGIVPVTAGGPLFQYWRFVQTGATAGSIDPAPIASAALTTAERFSAVRVTAAFAAQPQRTASTDLRATTVEGTATVGSAEASDPVKGVNC